VNDKPGFVYSHEGHITRTKPVAAGCADLASNTTRAFDHPLNRRCCLKFFVEIVFKFLDPGFVSLKEMISHNRSADEEVPIRRTIELHIMSVQPRVSGWSCAAKKKPTGIASIHKETNTVID